jgi:sensor histidine kinase regulating citrate/malate metabolism
LIAEAEARISTTPYETLEEAVDAANAMDPAEGEFVEIVLLKNIELDQKITISKNTKISGAYTIYRAKEYLDQMEQEIRIYEDQNKTGNRVLDVVLTAKSTHCRARDIEMKVIADGSLLDFMDDMEISALFGNMLDNAIENAEKQPDHEKRLISLYVTREKGFLLIRMQNYCDEKLKFKNGMPVTTKADHHLHGYGMKSMQKTVQKYNGSVVAAQENNWFVLRILIPLKEVPDPHTGKEKGTP